MATCAGGHESQRSDYCDVCGKPLTSSSPRQRHSNRAPDSSESCPRCHTPRRGRFCERCGYEFESRGSRAGSDAPAPPEGPPRWFAVVTADRSQYELARKRSQRIVFPTCCPERRIALSAPRTRIGRRCAADAAPPEIDLSAAPEDPAVSHRHAELIARDDGMWDLVDLGSKNGTYLDGRADRIPRNTPSHVGNGIQIRIGAWTVITLELDY